MGKAWDEELGGDNFDQLLLNQFADEYNAKFGSKADSKDIRTFPRAVARLKKLATKTKEVLSANIMTPASAEGLHDGNDFRTSVTREFLEEAAQPFIPVSSSPLHAFVILLTMRALARAHLCESRPPRHTGL
jgi:molecular chaperone DnaK (HSP70)